jgi:hypothetical protein
MKIDETCSMLENQPCYFSLSLSLISSKLPLLLSTFASKARNPQGFERHEYVEFGK